MYPLGTGTTYVYNQSTSLDMSDSVSAWNSWTGTSYLATSSDISTCGSTHSCVYVVNEGATIGGCAAPTLPDDGSVWAATYLEAYPAVNNMGCDFGTTSHPIYIIVLNSSMSFNAPQLQHIRRHEMGHVLGLDDTSTACWLDVVWYPIMHNGSANCSGHYPENATPSANEAYWAGQWGF